MKDVYVNDNKPPITNYSMIILPFRWYQGAAPPVIPLKGRRTTAGLVPSLQSLNGSLWALHFFPPGEPPAAHSGVSRGTPILQWRPVIHTSLTCTHSDVNCAMVVPLYWFQRTWNVMLGGQSVASCWWHSFFSFFFRRKWLYRLEVCEFQLMFQAKYPHLSLPVTVGKC